MQDINAQLIFFLFENPELCSYCVRCVEAQSFAKFGTNFDNFLGTPDLETDMPKLIPKTNHQNIIRFSIFPSVYLYICLLCLSVCHSVILSAVKLLV
jgi:hypothetical protein